MKAAIITASARASAGVYEDKSGEILKAGLISLGYEVPDVVIVPDDLKQISDAIASALAMKTDLIVTTGGTGISPTDVTPEATATSLIAKFAATSATTDRRTSCALG